MGVPHANHSSSLNQPCWRSLLPKAEFKAAAVYRNWYNQIELMGNYVFV